MPNTKKTPARTALLNTLEDLLHKKPFQKISVNELCETAQVSRSAFYANFEDKYQLLSCCLHEKTEDLDWLMQQHSPRDFLYIMLDFIQEKDRFFYNAFAADPTRELAEILYQLSYEHLTGLLREKAAQGAVLPGPIDAIAPFYIGGITTMVIRWIKSNYKTPKKELADCQYQLLKDIL